MNLLEDLRGLVGVKVGAGVELMQAYAEGEHAPVTLAGQYRLCARGVGVELEMIENATKRRSIVYARDGEAIYLFIRPGSYGFHLRFLSPPGRYAARLDLVKMGVAARLGFLAKKALGVLRRPPSAWLEVAGRLAGPSQGVTGASLGAAAAPAVVRTDGPRTVEAPGEADRDAAVSIIIPTKTQLNLLSSCVASLDMSPVRKELIVVDNGATDPAMIAYLSTLSFRPDVRLLRHQAPFNFSELCNLGARVARYPHLLFLNDDIEALDAGWLKTMLDYLTRDDVGVVGARLIYPDGALQHGGVAVNLAPGPGHPWRGMPREDWEGEGEGGLIGRPGEVDAVTGACLMIDKALFERLGGFDEEAFPVTLNDVDLCLKVRARGLKVIYAPQATLVHKEGRSRKRDDSPGEIGRREAELKAFYERYGDLTRHSVFYPPDLRRDTDTGAAI